MSKSIGWAATSATSPLSRYVFERREPRINDVVIDILFCGVCHSDIHTARNEWPGTVYPIVPGHEIIGRVTRRGDEVTKFQIGDLVGVGCMVDSCLSCDECLAGLVQYCVSGHTWTYGSEDDLEEQTQGGYSDRIVVREEFVVRIPTSLDPASAAPLLCAGITTYSALRHWKAGPGSRVGIAGFGGLGDMGVKLAKALGAEVVVLTRSVNKMTAALKVGADAVVDVADDAAMHKTERTLDLIVSTIPRSHDVEPYLKLLKVDGTYVILGAIEPMKEPYDSVELVSRRASIAGSDIGGLRETQELLDFCAENKILSNVQVVSIDEVNDVYDRIAAGEPAHRYVIDMSSLN